MAKGSRKDPIPALEWLAAAVGLLVALVLLGIIGREAIRADGVEIPILAAQLEAVEKTPTGYVAKVLITNRAGQTAARVELEGTAGSEVSNVSIDYVPGRSQAEAGLLFEQDPRRGGLKLRVTGYQLP
jgi:uncharacterized protein (TIGR02588 family)